MRRLRAARKLGRTLGFVGRDLGSGPRVLEAQLRCDDNGNVIITLGRAVCSVVRGPMLSSARCFVSHRHYWQDTIGPPMRSA